MSDVKRYYVRGVHWAEAGEATRECDCSWPCVKVVKAEDFDALASRLSAVSNALNVDYAENDLAAHRRVILAVQRIVSPETNEPERVVETGRAVCVHGNGPTCSACAVETADVESVRAVDTGPFVPATHGAVVEKRERIPPREERCGNTPCCRPRGHEGPCSSYWIEGE
jgi:hypothetical protein